MDNKNITLTTKIIVTLLVVVIFIFGVIKIRQARAIRYYQKGSEFLKEGNFEKALTEFTRAIKYAPESTWIQAAKNKLLFCQLVLGEKLTSNFQEGGGSLMAWLSTNFAINSIALFLIVLAVISFLHFKKLKKKQREEQYLYYLRNVETRIRLYTRPTTTGTKDTFDGVEDYKNYLAYFKNNEYSLLAQCLIDEYYLENAAENKNLSVNLSQSYTRFLQAYPNSNYNEELQQKLGNLYFFRLDDYAQAQAAYQIILDKYPQSKWIKIAQARVQLIKENPDFNYEPLKLYIKAERHYENKKYPEAIDNFKKLIIDYPQTNLAIQAQYNIGDIYLYKINNTEKAIEEYQQIVLHYASSSFAGKAQYKIGECYKKLSKWTEAVQAYQKFINDYPDAEFLDYAYYYIGFCHEQLKNMPQAKEAYQTIIQKFTTSIWVVVAESRLAILDKG